MIFWITLGVLIGAGIWTACSSYYEDTPRYLVVLFASVLVIMLILLGIEYVGADQYVESMNVRYETLTYQYENNFYDNDNDVGKYELMQDIREWNEDLAANKVKQHNFWYGIFVPDIYDQFEFIELK